MNIHEYQAKELLREYGVNSGNGILITNIDETQKSLENFRGSKYVVKAQIHAGGRGKAGGVRVCHSLEEASSFIKSLLGKKLVTHQTGPFGQKVSKLYVEEASEILEEYYFSIILDTHSSSITFICSREGGVDIEEVASKNPEKIIKIKIDNKIGFSNFYARELARRMKFNPQNMKEFIKIIESTYKLLVEKDAYQVEINPLCLVKETDSNGDIIKTLKALDAKITFDENALYRQKEIFALRDSSQEDELEVIAKESDLNYIRMDGNIGCMVNGAGLAMATMDIIKLAGAQPANFLDVGGGATKENVTKAFKLIVSDQNVKAIFVNIFGGIMKCDVIAEGIVAAAKDIDLKLPLVVRLSGTNFQLGKEILNSSGLNIIAADDLESGARKIVDSL